MSGPVPDKPKIDHIAHVDRLPSIVHDGCLWCDAEIAQRSPPGTEIGMSKIKQRRLNELTLSNCHPGLYVGGCVPFYFCPRSVMLYLICQRNHPELSYKGGQEPIIHLEADLYDTVAWAQANGRRWAFTLSNAGSRYFEDRGDLAQLGELDWDAISVRRWSGSGISSTVKENKQAEFLLEHSFPWELVERVGVFSQQFYGLTTNFTAQSAHKPARQIMRKWYY